MAADNPTTNWMMLERFVFRRDGDDPFPKAEERAPYTTDDHTYPGDSFFVAFRIAKPPEISRLYLKWESGPKTGPRCVPVAAHRNLLLVGLTPDPDPAKMEKTRFSRIPYFEPQRLFLCRPSCLRYDPPDSPPLLLQHIPMCTIKVVLRVKKNGTQVTMDRKFELDTLGILCRGEEEFVVAQIVLSRPPTEAIMEAELCILRSSIKNRGHEHSWEIEEGLHVIYEAEEFSDLEAWSTERVVPFNDALCWVNYAIGGLLICRVFEKRPTVSYLRLPILNRSLNQRPLIDINSSIGVTKGAAGVHDLIFVYVVREDGHLTGPLSPSTGFTVSYYILRTSETGRMEWKLIHLLTSAQLWELNESIPREPLTFPHVSMDDPEVVFFLVSQKDERHKRFPKVSVVAIDMSTSKLISVEPYFGGSDFAKDSNMVIRRSSYLESFLPSDLPKFMSKHVFDAPAPTPAAPPPSPQVNISTAVVPDCPAFNTRSRRK